MSGVQTTNSNSLFFKICLELCLVLRVDEIDTESCIGVSHALGFERTIMVELQIV